MQNRVFIDTNTLIYAYSDTEPEKKATTLAILESYQIIISTQVVNEFIWAMHRKYGVDLGKMLALLERFWQKFEIALLDRFDIEKAIKIAIQYKFSYWDSLIIASALKNKCDTLYTEDLQDGQVIEGKLVIKNPFK